jgi:phosphoribosylaminoimidazole-succinocarboxamide synthase
LVESEKLPQPLFTPSTKAEQGEHDENISPARGSSFYLYKCWTSCTDIIHAWTRLAAAEIIGPALCARIEKVALELYASAAAYALERGLILADTKFEFGLLPSANTSPESDDDGELILIDEALTPDSSRYWPLQGYAPGGPQPSFDKQYLRDWLVSAGFRKGLEGGPEGKEGEGWMIDEEVVKGTRKRYVEARDMLLKDWGIDDLIIIECMNVPYLEYQSVVALHTVLETPR